MFPENTAGSKKPRESPVPPRHVALRCTLSLGEEERKVNVEKCVCVARWLHITPFWVRFFRSKVIFTGSDCVWRRSGIYSRVKRDLYSTILHA